MVLMRLPNFSRRADKHCTCGPNVAHSQLSNHRMRLRVVMRLRVDALNSSLRSPFAKNVARGSLRKSKAQGKTESATRGASRKLLHMNRLVVRPNVRILVAATQENGVGGDLRGVWDALRLGRLNQFLKRIDQRGLFHRFGHPDLGCPGHLGAQLCGAKSYSLWDERGRELLFVFRLQSETQLWPIREF
jgi:hypothetical protein